jgi:hypothetical protein
MSLVLAASPVVDGEAAPVRVVSATGARVARLRELGEAAGLAVDGWEIVSDRKVALTRLKAEEWRGVFLVDGGAEEFLAETRRRGGGAVAVVVLGPEEGPVLDVTAVRAGAADYLVPELTDAALLERVVRQAAELENKRGRSGKER